MIVSVTKEGTITGNITIRVTPMTLNQYQNMFGDPPEDADGDPAEGMLCNNSYNGSITTGMLWVLIF